VKEKGSHFIMNSFSNENCHKGLNSLILNNV